MSPRTPVSEGQTAVILSASLILAIPSLVPHSATTQDAKSVEVRCEVEGRPQILFLVPDGSKVKKGDLICELDSAGLRELLTEKQIQVKQAEAEAEASKQALAVVEQGVAESRATMDEAITSEQGRIKTLEIDLKICDDTLANSAVLERSLEGLAILKQARMDRPILKAAMSNARTKLKALKDVTKPNRELILQSDLRKAKAEWTAKSGILKLETAAEARLARMIARCKIQAEQPGLVLHANPENPGPNTIWIEEGAVLRERQLILRIFTD